MNLICISSLNKNYSSKQIIKDFSLSIKNGEFISLVGPYGCGKSTLFRLISGLDIKYSGKITVNGVKPDTARQERKIGYCFQRPTLLPWRTVKENLLLPFDIAKVRVDEKIVNSYLSAVGLSSIANFPIKEISGGMQQLTAIIRGLVLNPDILLLDEPLSSIDEISREKMQEMLLRVHRESKKTTVMITHSISEAVFLSDRVVILSPCPMMIKSVVETKFSERNKIIRYSKEYIQIVKKIRSLLGNE